MQLARSPDNEPARASWLQVAAALEQRSPLRPEPAGDDVARRRGWWGGGARLGGAARRWLTWAHEALGDVAAALDPLQAALTVWMLVSLAWMLAQVMSL